MKYLKQARHNVSFILAITLSVGLAFAWQNSAGLHTKHGAETSDDTSREVTIRVPVRGGKHVNFFEGRELSTGADPSGSQQAALVSADFDSDGVTDIATADADGRLRLLKGIGPTNFAIDPSGQKRTETEPFSAVAIAAQLGISPDLMFTGDFNADGKQDILAAAKGSRDLTFLGGDGTGNFSSPRSINVGGNITAAATGQIGQSDGQADLAVSVTNENGSFVLVYEHPEGAFKHPPEIIELPSPTNYLAIGNTDEDHYSDIAIACGSDLVIVHERGQAYPWDILKDSGIKRPPPIVDVRRMPFSVAAIAAGRFGERRSSSLSLLGADGNIYLLEPAPKPADPRMAAVMHRTAGLTSIAFKPTGSDTAAYLMSDTRSRPRISGGSDPFGNPIADRTEIRNGGDSGEIRSLLDESASKTTAPTAAEIVKEKALGDAKRSELQEKGKAGYIQAISSRSTALTSWKLTELSSGAKFAVAASSNDVRLLRANVADSPLDDLIVTSSDSDRIEIFSQVRSDSDRLTGQYTSLESDGPSNAVIPVRLNFDGFDDLIVLQPGRTEPSVVMSAPSAVFYVTSNDDSGSCISPDPCSLRNAIIGANGNPGADVIVFQLADGTIRPSQELPPVTDSVSIIGPNAVPGQHLVEISGENVPAPADGLKIRASNCFITSIGINNFRGTVNGNSLIGGNGITLESTSTSPNNGQNTVTSVLLGTDLSGMLARSNQGAGMLIFDSDDNFIGGNVMSGNGAGLSVTDGNLNRFENNIIGLNAPGTAKLPNSTGVFLTGANNLFGNDIQGNTVSGNGVPYNPTQCSGHGVVTPLLFNLGTGEQLTLNNELKGNRIGTDPLGTIGLGNCSQGVYTAPSTQTTVGSITESGRNVLSGNGRGAIACGDLLGNFLPEGGFCGIAGNNIGTNLDGTAAIPNTHENQPTGFDRSRGIVDLVHFSPSYYSYFGAPGGYFSGGPCTGFCNLYSGNQNNVQSSLYFTGYGNAGIFDNFIGTNKAGTQAIPNINGIEFGNLLYGNVYIGGVGDDGGVPISLGNLISGQPYGAVSAGTYDATFGGGYSSSLGIQGNKIGTDVTGTAAIPNGQGSVIYTFRGFTETATIGGTDPLARNIISGNTGIGIVSGSILGLGTNTTVSNNLIGVNVNGAPLGNGGMGVAVFGYGAVVGGIGAQANEIAYNGGTSTSPGVLVGSGGAGISVRGNSIHDNAGLGIDVSDTLYFQPSDGVTENDCLDGDLGPNGRQNYPVLLSTNTNGGNTSVIGYLRSSPSQDYEIDFYSSDVADPTQHGEGTVHLDSISVTTNGSGFRSFEFVLPPTAFGLITATATDSFGNTSEFSCDVGACADPVRPVKTKEDVDEFYGTSICADPIVVNSTSDAEDADLLDETCDFDEVQPGPQCSLRAAIQEAENQPGANTILFDIPGGGTHTLLPGEAYPILNQPVTIDATSQPGYSDTPLVVLDGSGTTNSNGLALRGGGSTIKGLSIVNFKEQIGISGSGGAGQNRIGANYIGVRPDGTLGNPVRQEFGITLVGAAMNNQIGGFRAENRNVIGGTGEGISINSNSTNNRVINNYVGVAADGVTSIANRDGIVVRDSPRNNIGGYINDSPNVIANNQVNGIWLINSSFNRVSGNLIGTTSTGDAAAGNITGVNIDAGSGNNIVGGTTFDEKNVISGHNATNNSVGVIIRPDAGTSNTVAGNYLGVSLNGDIGLPNRIGIAVNADNQTIGNAGENDYRNLIVSADTAGAYGIYLHPFSPNDVLENVIVQNNTIGTLIINNASSGEVGIYLTGDVNGCTVKGNTIGHQSFAGIRLFDGPHNNTISANRVGIKTTNEEIPNYNGIAIRQADTNFIRDNTVSANTNNGIVIGDSFGQNDRPAPLVERGRVFGGSVYASNNIVTGNRVGTDVDSTYLIPNGQVAIGVGLNARDSRIGGPGAEGNVVGGAGGPDWPFGIFVGTINDVANVNEIPHNIKVEGNHVGAGPDPDQVSLPNGYGIYVRNAVATIIGGDTAAKGNVVGYNTNDGIRIFKPLTTDTIVQNNFVGVFADGNLAPNGGDGISVDNTGNIEISFNVVGGNGQNGIRLANLSGPSSTRSPGQRPSDLFGIAKLFGNCSGCFPDTNGVLQPIANELDGLYMDQVFNAEIGKLAQQVSDDVMNKFSGNHGRGISVEGGEANKINNNLAGTGKFGEQNVQNLLEGLKLSNSNNNLVGSPGMGNTFASNGGDGIRSESSNGGSFYGNLSGVIRDATDQSLQPRANGGSGLSVVNSALNQIGNIGAGYGNVFAANQQIGVIFDGFQASANRMWNNKVGVVEDPPPPPPEQRLPKFRVAGINFGNASHGILITNAANGTMIGGPLAGSGNIIGGNGGSGVWIDPTAGEGNLVDPNVIYGNAGLGIDLGPLGHTPNDPDDVDSGPNRLQNYPIIANFVINVDGDLLVTYSVDSTEPNSNYGLDGLYVEFFIADAGGEGKTFLGSDNYTMADHDSSVAGNKTVNLGNAATLGFVTGMRLTSTATDADRNTSEFFPALAPSAEGAVISGRATRSNGSGINKALITLTSTAGLVRRTFTNGLGNYVFDDVPTGQTYVISISHKSFVFHSSTRIISITGDLADVDFEAEP